MTEGREGGRSLAWVATLIAVGVSLRVACHVGQTWWDTFAYAGVALGGNPIARFASRYGMVWPVALLQRLLGTDSPTLAVYPLLCSTATLVTTWALGRRLHGESCGRWAALLLALTPIELVYATQYMPDVCVAFWISLAILCLLRAADGPTRTSLVLAAAACWVGAQTKEVTVALGPCFLWLAWRAARWRGVSWFGVGVLASGACDAAICAWLWGDPAWKVRAFLEEGLGANTNDWTQGFASRSLVEVFLTRQGSHAPLLPIAVAALAAPADSGFGRRLVVMWLALVGGFFVTCDLAFQKLKLEPRYLADLSVPLAILGGRLLGRLWGPCGFRHLAWGGGACGVATLLSLFGPGALRVTAWGPLTGSLLGPLVVALALAIAWSRRSAFALRGAAALLLLALGVHAGTWAGVWSAYRRWTYEGIRAPLELLRSLPPGKAHVAPMYLCQAAFWSGYRADLPLVHPYDGREWLRDLSFRAPLWTPTRWFDARAPRPGDEPPRYRVVDADGESTIDTQRWTLLFRRDLRVYLWSPSRRDRDRFLQDTEALPRTLGLTEARARVHLASGRPGRALAELSAVRWEDEPSGQMGLLYEEASATAAHAVARTRAATWIRARDVVGTATSAPGRQLTLAFEPGPVPPRRSCLLADARLSGPQALLVAWRIRVSGFLQGRAAHVVVVRFLDEQGGVVLNRRLSVPLAAGEWATRTLSLPRPPATARRVRVSVEFSGTTGTGGVVQFDRVRLLRTDG